MPRDDDDSPSRQLLVGLGALLAVALLVGGVMSVVALGAASMSGIESTAGGASVRPSLYLPSLSPTKNTDTTPVPVETETPTTPTDEPSPATASKQPKVITLQASPSQVGPGGRIDLNGVFQAGEGHTVTVQRFENGWSDFPVSATVSGGSFHTWISTSRAGLQRFRVVDHATDKHSNEVRVTVS